MLVVSMIMYRLLIFSLAIMGNAFKDTKHPGHRKVTRGELRGDIFACGQISGRIWLQIGQRTITGEGKV